MLFYSTLLAPTISLRGEGVIPGLPIPRIPFFDDSYNTPILLIRSRSWGELLIRIPPKEKSVLRLFCKPPPYSVLYIPFSILLSLSKQKHVLFSILIPCDPFLESFYDHFIPVCRLPPSERFVDKYFPFLSPPSKTPAVPQILYEIHFQRACAVLRFIVKNLWNTSAEIGWFFSF